jgi:GTP-binding protein Era
LPILKNAKMRHDFDSIIPLSALHDKNMDALIKGLCAHSPRSEFLFPKDIKWERDDVFVITEVVRGAAMVQLQKELPYAIYTEVEELNFDENLVTIGVVIWVEKESQKPIVIGKRGAKLKAIGQQSRIKLERIFKRKVMLKTWVKVKQNWQDLQDVVAQFEQ